MKIFFKILLTILLFVQVIVAGVMFYFFKILPGNVLSNIIFFSLCLLTVFFLIFIYQSKRFKIIIVSVFIIVIFSTVLFSKKYSYSCWLNYESDVKELSNYRIKMILKYDELDSEWFHTYKIYENNFFFIPQYVKSIDDPSGQEFKYSVSLIMINNKIYSVLYEKDTGIEIKKTKLN